MLVPSFRGARRVTGGGATPVVVDGDTVITESGATDPHTINVATNVQAGDLLVIFYFSGGPLTEIVSDPAGWTVVDTGERQDTTTGASVVYSKVSDGTETTAVVDRSQTRIFAAVCVRITGADSTVEAAFSAGAQSTNPDPPSLSPSGGAKNYLWLAAAFTDYDSGETPPANYTMIAQGTASARQVYLAERALNAATENPGAYSGTLGSEFPGAFTAAIAPA